MKVDMDEDYAVTDLTAAIANGKACSTGDI